MRHYILVEVSHETPTKAASMIGVIRKEIHRVAGDLGGAVLGLCLHGALHIAVRDNIEDDDGSAQRRAALFDHVRASAPAVRPEVLLERGGWVDVPHVLDEAPIPLG